VDTGLAPDFDNLAAVLPTRWLSRKGYPRLLARFRPDGLRVMDRGTRRAIRTEHEAKIELSRAPAFGKSFWQQKSHSCSGVGARPAPTLRSGNGGNARLAPVRWQRELYCQHQTGSLSCYRPLARPENPEKSEGGLVVPQTSGDRKGGNYLQRCCGSPVSLASSRDRTSFR
jgi:hypothetical protein